jgi:hypothetical protein
MLGSFARLSIALCAATVGSAALAQSFEYVSAAPVGAKVTVRGKIEQIIKGSPNYELRVDMTEKPYGIWTDTIWVFYRETEARPDHISEGDVVEFDGRALGMGEYKTVLGVTKRVPSFAACTMTILNGPFRYPPQPC